MTVVPLVTCKRNKIAHHLRKCRAHTILLQKDTIDWSISSIDCNISVSARHYVNKTHTQNIHRRPAKRLYSHWHRQGCVHLAIFTPAGHTHPHTSSVKFKDASDRCLTNWEEDRLNFFFFLFRWYHHLLVLFYLSLSLQDQHILWSRSHPLEQVWVRVCVAQVIHKSTVYIPSFLVYILILARTLAISFDHRFTFHYSWTFHTLFSIIDIHSTHPC